MRILLVLFTLLAFIDVFVDDFNFQDVNNPLYGYLISEMNSEIMAQNTTNSTYPTTASNSSSNSTGGN
jgi:hypothetical protein